MKKGAEAYMSYPAIGATVTYTHQPQALYREWDSNPHGRFGPGDFKSPVSTIPPSRHIV